MRLLLLVGKMPNGAPNDCGVGAREGGAATKQADAG
jgi:hypothetical protein